jgi:hypothetical protein
MLGSALRRSMLMRRGATLRRASKADATLMVIILQI